MNTVEIYKVVGNLIEVHGVDKVSSMVQRMSKDFDCDKTTLKITDIVCSEMDVPKQYVVKSGKRKNTDQLITQTYLFHFLHTYGTIDIPSIREYLGMNMNSQRTYYSKIKEYHVSNLNPKIKEHRELIEKWNNIETKIKESLSLISSSSESQNN